MSVLAVHVDLFQELEARLKAIPRKYVLQAVQDFFILGIFLVLKKEKAAFNLAVITKLQSLSTQHSHPEESNFTKQHYRNPDVDW